MTIAKVILLGNSNVGKTCIARILNGDVFQETGATVGANEILITRTFENQLLKFKLWDTAGQEKFRSLMPMYVRGAQIALLVYDLTNRNSFEMLNLYFDILKESDEQFPQTILIGNKIDLELKTVSDTELESKQKQFENEIHLDNIIKIVQMSAKTGQGLDILLSTLCDCFNSINCVSQECFKSTDINAPQDQTSCC